MTVLSEFINNPSAAPLLAALHVTCFDRNWDEQTFSKQLEIPGTIAQFMEKGDAPLAFALYRVIGDETEILTLGVVPEARGQAIGYQLVKEGMNKLEKAGTRVLFLEVSTTNTAAISLYRKCGFYEVGRRRKYYREGSNLVDALIMEKKFQVEPK